MKMSDRIISILESRDDFDSKKAKEFYGEVSDIAVSVDDLVGGGYFARMFPSEAKMIKDVSLELTKVLKSMSDKIDRGK